MRLPNVVFLALVVGCRPTPQRSEAPAHVDTDPYTTDLRTICGAEAASGVTAATAQGTMRVWEWIQANVHSPSGRNVLRNLNVIPLEARITALRSEARSHGIVPCQLADTWAAATTTPEH